MGTETIWYSTFKNILRLKLQTIENYEQFKQAILQTLNEQARLKKTFLKENDLPYIAKSLHKTVKQRSELESKYLENRTIEKLIKYNRQNNYCINL